jgi:hypothetical protein
MTFKGLLVVKAIVCLVFGIQLLAAPGFLFGLLGASLAKAGTFAAREYAAAMLGTLMLCWFARNAVQSEARRPILLHLFVYDAIGFLVTASVVFAGTLNALGWGIALVYLFFTLGSGYLLCIKREAA